MKTRFKLLIFATLSVITGWTPSAMACKGRSMILNKSDSAVTFCFDQGLKAYLSEDCFKLGKDNKACEIRSVISRNRFSPVKLSALELQTAENPDAVACEKLKQKIRVLIDSEGVQHTFCESKFDGSLAPLYLFKWRV
jgi:hypothetical protein